MKRMWQKMKGLLNRNGESGQIQLFLYIPLAILATIVALVTIPAIVAIIGPTLTTSSAIALLESEGYWVLAQGDQYPGDFIPSANNTYTLGSNSYQWKELHVAGGSIYLGTVALTDSGGCLTTSEFHAHGAGGEAGYLKMGFGATPTHAEANHAILWVDSSEVLYFQKADGTDLEVVKLDSSGKLVVVAADITDNFTVDTSTLFVDSTGNRIGIGTDNPESKLHLADTGSLQLILHADTD